jgi:hypothetical protein
MLGHHLWPGPRSRRTSHPAIWATAAADESISFYTKLFGTGPAKVRPGYANFAIADPPLKLILMENRGQGGSLNHLGVEVPGSGGQPMEPAETQDATRG